MAFVACSDPSPLVLVVAAAVVVAAALVGMSRMSIWARQKSSTCDVALVVVLAVVVVGRKTPCIGGLDYDDNDDNDSLQSVSNSHFPNYFYHHQSHFSIRIATTTIRRDCVGTTPRPIGYLLLVDRDNKDNIVRQHRVVVVAVVVLLIPSTQHRRQIPSESGQIRFSWPVWHQLVSCWILDLVVSCPLEEI
jgi:hypothetical protein